MKVKLLILTSPGYGIEVADVPCVFVLNRF
jgi:hypothetical protein